MCVGRNASYTLHPGTTGWVGARAGVNTETKRKNVPLSPSEYYTTNNFVESYRSPNTVRQGKGVLYL